MVDDEGRRSRLGEGACRRGGLRRQSGAGEGYCFRTLMAQRGQRDKKGHWRTLMAFMTPTVNFLVAISS